MVLAATACSDREPAGPQPQGITPASGPADSPTTVSIQGRFYPVVRANFDDEKRAQVSSTFEASLGVSRLAEVRLLSGGELAARVPAGIAPGLYDLVITDARGRAGTLPGAYRVLGAGPGDLGADAAPDRSRPDARGDATSVDHRRPDLRVDAARPDTAPPPQVTTLAGSATMGFADGPAATAQFQHPTAVAYLAGTVYVSDYGNHRIRLVKNGTVSTLAGSGAQGLKNGAAASSEFNYPDGIAVDPAGTVYVADSANDVIRKIAAGTVSVAAGTGVKGALNGAVTTATFNFPRGLLLSGSTIYVADTGNHRIRTVQAGQVTTLAGGAQGYLDGPVASARFNGPTAMALDASGAIVVADTGNHRIRVIQSGQVSTLAGTGNPGAVDGPAASASFWNPSGLAFSTPRLFIADQTNHRIRTLESGTVGTLTGITYGFADGLLKDALFYYPQGLAMGAFGELFVADQNNHRIRRVQLP